MKIKSIHADVWVGIILLVISLIGLFFAQSFTNKTAKVWPSVVLVIMMFFAAIILIQGIRLTRSHADPALIPGGQFFGAMMTLAYMILYAIAMDLTGYFISTAIFLPIGMIALGQRSWKVVLGVTVGLELFIYFVFVMQLSLRMP